MIIWINCQRQSGVPTWPRPRRGGVDGKVSISVFPGANDCVCCDYHSWLWKIAIHFWILDDLTLSRQRTWSWRENKWQFYRLLRREHGGHSLPQVDQYTNQCDFKSLKEFGMSKCDLIRMSEPGGVSPRGYYHRSALLLQVRFSALLSMKRTNPINISFIYIVVLGQLVLHSSTYAPALSVVVL